MSETPRQKFSRLATKRVNNALKCIQLIGNLSNKSNYDYTSEEVNRIFEVLSEEVRKSKIRFSQVKDKKARFEL